jgi:sterol desaturase/sphingolipid hydroxylase (fatty acid hydroxylase superfamily)
MAVPVMSLLVGFVSALFVGTLVEYLVHRLMHSRKLLARKHAQHHREGDGQGFLGEFWDYLLGVAGVLAVGFAVAYFGLDSLEGGIGFAAGGVVYAALAAYAHQLQHERPELVFWLRRPVHHLHHKHHMWHYNFGILVDFWDRVFGTYKVVEGPAPADPRPWSFRDYFRIRWY